ncbi:MAG: sensor histidine kinase [Saprospiraceae bacterium]|nr:sensor histidine kinase [Candidatus Opimibacter skivensis]
MKLNALLVEQKKHHESRLLLPELLELAVVSRNGRVEAEVNQALYENAKALGEPVKALMYMERFNAINDSLHLEDMQTQIQDLNVKFEVAQKDHEIERQNISLQQGRRNRNFLMLIIGLLAGMAVLTILYFRSRIRTARRLREQEEIIHQQDKEKLRQEKELVQLTTSLDSQERERTRIARDLHDGLGSLMSGISAQVENLLFKDPANSHYTSLKELVKETATELRRTSYELMPATLLRMGLDPAIRDLCFNLLVKNGIEPRLELEADVTHLSSDQQLIVYRILQELLHNIVKHAAATHVLVQLNSFDDEMTLVVEDDGKGFLIDNSTSYGIGLGSIKSRVDLLGGFLDIASSPGEGTTVTINFQIQIIPTVKPKDQ